jgi:hypothetical protein
MPQTHLSIDGESFRLNGDLSYAEIDSCPATNRGLLLNARFIQGVFDDRAEPGRFARWGHAAWDPEANTQNLIDALQDWQAQGLRAFTVGLQGGGPCFTIDNDSIDNNPFGTDGQALDPAYAQRLDRLIRGADACGMVVIVSYFYGSQAKRLRDGRAVRAAVSTASRFLREGGYTNVLIEVANELNIGQFKDHPLIQQPEGMASLIDLARQESGGLAVGCSGGGGYINREVAEASDYVLIHGNGCSRQRFYNMVQQVRSWNLNRPIVCNEDSQALGNMAVALRQGVSWGYYNNMTKQEPPTDWGITPGEDAFFAHRMATAVGLAPSVPAPEDQFYLQGLEKPMHYQGQRWIRLASLYPERIERVEFFCNDERVYTNYDEPFTLFFQTNWRQKAWHVRPQDRQWRADIYLSDGSLVQQTATAQ